MTTKFLVMLREGTDHTGMSEKLQRAAYRNGLGYGFDVNPNLVGTFLMEVTGAKDLMQIIEELPEVEIVAPRPRKLLFNDV